MRLLSKTFESVCECVCIHTLLYFSNYF